jgi:hypothetical protein
MGITIHYSGRASSRQAMTRAMNHAFMFGAQREWQAAIAEDPFGDYEDVDPDNPGLVDEERKGPYASVVLRPHADCEPFSLRFSLSREFSGFTKTQSAPFEVHQELVQLLRQLEPFMDYLHVTDESGLWESGYAAAARERFGFPAPAIGRLAEGLAEEGLDVDDPDRPPDDDGDRLDGPGQEPLT